MKFTAPVGVLLFAIAGFSGSVPLQKNWESDLHSFSDKFTKLLNATTLPILAASAYLPEDWYKIVQDKIPKTAVFPCNNDENKPKWRSRKSPTSVHELRPGDIDVIMTLGDSLSAGTSAREPAPMGFFIDDRGVSFIGGGERTWREHTTVPNFLKVFNPHLHGYAVGKGTFFSENANLNVAISGSTDDNLLAQAQFLAQKALATVDLENDWKLINIFIGHNDICSYECFDPENHSAKKHKERLKEVLDLIYNSVPKVFVNLISLLDPTLTARYPNTPACHLLRNIVCPCLLQLPDLKENIVKMAAVARKYQKVEKELASSKRYKGRRDFAVVNQPVLAALNGPKNVGDSESPIFTKLFSPKLPLWTPDCFHFNQRGSAIVARMIWNNMLEPVGRKTSTLEEINLHGIKCPSKSHPYLFTEENSEPQ